MKKKVFIDIGHAEKTGAKGLRGSDEHYIARIIGEQLQHDLFSIGMDAFICDYPKLSNEMDLIKTASTANNWNPDVGLSLHCDCSDNAAARGAHVCYLTTTGKAVAGSISSYLCQLLPGRAEKTVLRDDLYILKNTRAPWVLIECGFISNKDDLEILSKSPEEVAKSIAQGISDYFEPSEE